MLELHQLQEMMDNVKNDIASLNQSMLEVVVSTVGANISGRTKVKST